MHVPQGFGVVTPYIFVDDADRYVAFLVSALGGIEVGRSTMPDGRIANCQVRFGSTTVMVSEASEQFPASKAAFYLYVENADAAMARAVTGGAEAIMDVADMPYDDRQGGVRDPAGNIWWISQRLTDRPYF
ncbi:VOC family protein [Pedomonas mirosovicensis]|uniref:VOC family protein n=1 Tax=Pedomonas mirosovicensis TaxID=2908641 RepID=UPI002166C3B9|nr:VOC family protein [Pedomonas mirosovicensis]MCH8685646.1 VOC family protein [Pedomonas mirosovicensis]